MHSREKQKSLNAKRIEELATKRVRDAEEITAQIKEKQAELKKLNEERASAIKTEKTVAAERKRESEIRFLGRIQH